MEQYLDYERNQKDPGSFVNDISLINESILKWYRTS